jgi:hypothetical protein
MKIELTPSAEFVAVDGYLCRVWRGTTDRGTPCFAYIHRLALHIDATDDEARELLEVAIPPDTVATHYERKDTN